jgi:hypothetical protein
MVSRGPRRRGNPGYPRLQAIPLLVYARLRRIGTDKVLIRHLNRNRRAVRSLRLNQIPHRTTEIVNHLEDLEQCRVADPSELVQKNSEENK